MYVTCMCAINLSSCQNITFQCLSRRSILGSTCLRGAKGSDGPGKGLNEGYYYYDTDTKAEMSVNLRLRHDWQPI